MYETGKCQKKREQAGHFRTFLRGRGIDVGAGDDPLGVPDGSVLPWDKEQGDAQCLPGVEDSSFDFLYSSHCLEHMADITATLANWIRVVKTGGFIYVVVPDYLLYEKGTWPSRYNSDHKHTFSMDIDRHKVERPNHWRIRQDIEPCLRSAGAVLLEAYLEDDGFDPKRFEEDQTMDGALSQICFIARRE
jgi:SAM-dependent methyltransferase